MVLTRMPQDLPFLNGASLGNDLLRSVLPGFLIAPDTDNTGQIYNRLVFPRSYAAGSGPGFSLLGYGYMQFGLGGLILVMVIMAGAIRAAYRWAGRSALGLLFFIGFAPVAMYVARNDLTSPMSQGLKHVLIPLAAMYVVAFLRGRDGTGARATLSWRAGLSARRG
jgi:peptidoglycan/LPS O-acetylase OafA/YrhL